MKLLQQKLLMKVKCLAEIQKAACVSSAKIFCSVQFFGQGPGLSSKCSAEVDGQLVSAVLRSSVGRG